MKKIFLTAVAMVFSISIGMAQTDISILPQNSQDFIKQHFSAETVKKVEKEDGLLNMDKSEAYELHFENGVKLDFDKNGEVTEIDSRQGATIPEDALPSEITQYVMENFPNTKVESWEKDNDEQEVELSDGTDLEFDRNGKFLKMD